MDNATPFFNGVINSLTVRPKRWTVFVPDAFLHSSISLLGCGRKLYSNITSHRLRRAVPVTTAIVRRRYFVAPFRSLTLLRTVCFVCCSGGPGRFLALAYGKHPPSRCSHSHTLPIPCQTNAKGHTKDRGCTTFRACSRAAPLEATAAFASDSQSHRRMTGR